MSSPFMVAVSGGSGSGKTTFVRILREKLCHLRPVVISIDHYYRDLAHMDKAERALQNFDNPNAIERELLHEHISALRQGVAVNRPSYDFASHSRTGATARLNPSRLIIVDGIFSLCFSELFDLLDLKIYLDVDDDIRVIRRIRRDMMERKRSFDSCVQQYLDSVKTMHKKYVEPSKRHADLIVPWHSLNQMALSNVAELIDSRFKVREPVHLAGEKLEGGGSYAVSYQKSMD